MSHFTTNDIISIVIIGIIMIGVGISVDLPAVKKYIKRPTALLVANANQYILMPFLCWCVAMAINPPNHVKAAFVILGTMPGGTISNILSMWLHVDIELSAAITSSTVLFSLATIPFNLWLYLSVIGFPVEEPLTWGHLKQSSWVNVSNTDGTYGAFEPDWLGIALDVVAVIGGLFLGLFLGNYALVNRPRASKATELLCLMAGIVQGVLGMINSSKSQLPIWAQPWPVYVGLCLMAALSFSITITTARLVFKFNKPQCISIGIEGSVQNAMIAISTIMLSIRNFELMGQALAIPIVYSTFSLIVTIVGGLIGWKLGWSNIDANGPNPCTVWCSEYRDDIRGVEKPAPESDNKSDESDEENLKKQAALVAPVN